MQGRVPSSLYGLGADAVLQTLKTSSSIEASRHSLLFTIEICNNFDSLFLSQELSSSDKSWRCFHHNFYHTKRLSQRRFISWLVRITCCYVSSLSSRSKTSARNSYSVPTNDVKYFSVNFNVSPGYGAIRILWAASTLKLSTTSSQQVQ